MFLYGAWGLQQMLSNAFAKPTVACGKYISKEITASTDASEGIPQHPAVVVERGSKEPLPCIRHPRFIQEWLSSGSIKAPERASSVLGKVESQLYAVQPEGCSRIESAITEEPIDHCAWFDEIPGDIDFEAKEAPTDGQPSIEVDNDAPLQTTILAIESSDDGLSSAIDDSAICLVGSETTAPKSNASRVVRERLARLRCRREQKSRIARAPIRCGKDKERAERALMLVDEGTEAGDLMVGLEFTEGDTEGVQGGEPMDSRPDDSAIDVDEVMIGSDVDGEMEIEGETLDLDKMEIDEDTPDLDKMEIEGETPDLVIGMPPQPVAAKITKVDSIENKAKCDQNKVVGSGVSRDQAGIPLREMPKFAISCPVVAPPQPSQQQVAPIPAPATGHTDANLLQGVAQHLISTNSAADLKEARLGKRSETSVAPSASNPAPIQTPTSSLPNGAMAENEDSSDATQPTTTPASSLPSSTTSPIPASLSVKDTASSSKKSGDGAGAGEAKDDRKKREGPGASNDDDASEPSPEKASKRVQQRRGNAAGADAEIIPLNELPDRAPTGKSTSTISQVFPLPTPLHHIRG